MSGRVGRDARWWREPISAPAKAVDAAAVAVTCDLSLDVLCAVGRRTMREPCVPDGGRPVPARGRLDVGEETDPDDGGVEVDVAAALTPLLDAASGRRARPWHSESRDGDFH
ncbi:hypothetical protein SHO565_64490 [Streptomyces sp. HO565]